VYTVQLRVCTGVRISTASLNTPITLSGNVTKQGGFLNINQPPPPPFSFPSNQIKIFFIYLQPQEEYHDTDPSGHRGEETDTDDDIGSFHDDGPDTSDEEGDKERKVESMEWDSTTAIYEHA